MLPGQALQGLVQRGQARCAAQPRIQHLHMRGVMLENFLAWGVGRGFLLQTLCLCCAGSQQQAGSQMSSTF